MKTGLRMPRKALGMVAFPGALWTQQTGLLVPFSGFLWALARASRSTVSVSALTEGESEYDIMVLDLHPHPATIL